MHQSIITKTKTSLYKIVTNNMLSPFLMLFPIFIRSFSLFFAFLYIIMYILNIARSIKKMAANAIKNFIFENIINELDFLRKTVIIH